MNMKTKAKSATEGLDPAKKDEFLKKARDRVQVAYTHWAPNWSNAKKKLAFLYGEQWDDHAIAERTEENRPWLTLNLMPQYVDQILGGQRQNKQNIHVAPANIQHFEEESGEQQLQNTQGKEFKRSEIFEGIIRQIEYKSKAMVHYGRAFKHAVESGFGWLRVYTDYESDDTFDQDIRIKSVKDRFAVLLDPTSSEPDYSDAKWGFIFDEVLNDDFEENWPDKQKGEFSAGDGDNFQWNAEKTTKVAEYFYQVPKKRKLLNLGNAETGADVTIWEDELIDPKTKKMDPKYSKEKGWITLREKMVDSHTFKWCKITSQDILEDSVDWASKYIPIVPVLGKEAVIDGKSMYFGVIQHGEDAQRLHNFFWTSAAERVALAPKAPFIAEDGAIEGYEDEWRQANTGNVSVLPYAEGKQKPERDQGASMPAAEIQLSLSAKDEIKGTLGMYDAAVGAQGNETSGRAILARKQESDTGTFEFTDNLSMAISQIGRISVDLLPSIYDGERIVRTLNEDGTGDWFRLNEMTRNPETGPGKVEWLIKNDVTIGNFDIMVKSGPGHLSQRMEMVESMMNFIQAVPTAAQAIMDVLVDNMDWPGADIIANRLKRIVPPNVLTEAEREELEIEDGNQADPNQQLEAQIAQADVQQKQLDFQIEQQKTQQKELELQQLQSELAGVDPKQIEMIVQQAMQNVIQQQQQQMAAAEQAKPQVRDSNGRMIGGLGGQDSQFGNSQLPPQQ